MKKKAFRPDRVSSYFKSQWPALLAVTVSGIIYNVGLLAGPWFEGQLTGTLIDLLAGQALWQDMALLVVSYVAITVIVQICRYIKRFYVRRFANNINRSMKTTLYDNLLHKSKRELESEGAGDLLTKAVLDVDDCAEGMRKFTTEIFDTGVALAAYAGMLLYYDFRLGLLAMLFLPVSYTVAEKMKVIVQRTSASYKKQAGLLSDATLDRASNAITYRVFGCNQARQKDYEAKLDAYEQTAIRANIWTAIMPSMYHVISMVGVIFIIYFGAKNVLGTGWSEWTVATFTTFIACFARLAKKSSSAAKLFNSVHKATISWRRIKGLLKPQESYRQLVEVKPGQLSVSHLSFGYPDAEEIIKDMSFTAKPGDIVGITGPVACGKSTLGRVFLCEYPYQGSITYGGKELRNMDDITLSSTVGYLGHDTELFSDTIRENILLGSQGDIQKLLKAVRIDEEVAQMEGGADTLIGDGGIRLSGGQAKRVALARILAHKKPLMILDDPFSALDKKTEQEIFDYIRANCRDSIILLISHRDYLFDQLDQVIRMEGSHEE